MDDKGVLGAASCVAPLGRKRPSLIEFIAGQHIKNMRLVEVGIVGALTILVVALAAGIGIIDLAVELVYEALDQAEVDAVGPAVTGVGTLGADAIGTDDQLVQFLVVSFSCELQIVADITSETGDQVVGALVG